MDNPSKKLDYGNRPLSRQISKDMRGDDWRYQLLEMEEIMLKAEVMKLSREELLHWLKWNDSNGIYGDKESLAHDIKPLTKSQSQIYVYHVVMRNREDWDGYMGLKYVRELEDFLG